MFWNGIGNPNLLAFSILTVNMKCFEIKKRMLRSNGKLILTVNMKCFEIRI